MHFLHRLMDSVRSFSDKIAINIGDVRISYDYLFRSAYAISKHFLNHSKNQNRVCLVISKKSLSLYQSLLACFFSNLIYTPINPNAPFSRNQKIVQFTDPDFIVIGDCQFDIACQLLCVIENKTVFVYKIEMYELLIQAAFLHHFVLISTEIDDLIPLEQHMISLNHNAAYLFFTSGSTGVPKGVPISNQNLSAYLDSVFSLFRFSEWDRVIQISDIAFDLSMHEILTAWCAGAALYVYDETNLLGVSHFIILNKITHSFFVPSAIPVIVKQCEFFNYDLGVLKKIFVCGEVFPMTYAQMLARYTPRAVIVNLYGPTETTIACSYHFYRKKMDYGCLQSVPIGFPFPTVSFSVASEGELIIGGDQVFNGYWPVKYDQEAVLSYQTGDCVSFDPRWGYIFQTRKDDQWKIQGYRIEKNEIEYALRSVFDIPEIFVSPIYQESNITKKLIAFSTSALNMARYKKQLLSLIPVSAMPDRCIQLNTIPKLPNGKVDYKSLSQLASLR